MDARRRLAAAGVAALAALLLLSPASPQAVSNYILGPGDLLEVSVWGYPDLTRTVAVRPDGRVSLPLVGEVRAAGLSVAQLTRVLTRAYAEYIREPQVTVIVKEFRRIRASALGQVERPGTYVLAPGSRLLDLLSEAGGLTEAAAPQGQLLVAGRPPKPVDLQKVLAGDATANLVLLGGETLVVPEDLTNIVNVLGEVQRPGRYRLKGEVRVLDALLMAGGLTEKASLGGARLVRASRETVALHLDALLLRQEMGHNLPLAPGDTLFIPEELNTRIYVLGDVNSPGAFPVRGPVTLLQAIAMAGGPVQRGAATARAVHIVRRNGGGDQVVAGGRVERLPNGGTLVSVELAALMQPAGAAREIAVLPGDVVVIPQSQLSGLQVILSILSGILGLFR
ncbi:MAG: SLBB domain-containing protein [Armatimonadota bacterium]|nr:SLBB domain-containing protein [Armatimonadota bacterium]MDR7449307.1 SLBB domain-containing protein [Armatimonadota bacterium]MDR7460776.1 SLBB domain-containing protein [Armatimonadota bacterium]MDR7479972.1 SLBB domain-containing protein [Armatimonadota bacterium]MDR7488638.1 SLBB domain-containing protein [Armatimonadota bacterium]